MKRPIDFVSLIKKFILFMVLLGIALYFIVPYFSPGSTFNCWKEYIDIKGGQYRYERFLLGMKIMDPVEDTDISRTTREAGLQLPEPEWYLIHTAMPMKNPIRGSEFYEALDVLQNLKDAFYWATFVPNAKKEIVESILALWQEDQDSIRAKIYTKSILRIARTRKNKHIYLAELPELPVQ